MLTTKVIASQITNLTDARYFGAWGVDYMGFCLDEGHENYISPASIKEMTGWVEGPQFFAEFRASTSKEYIEFITKEAGLDIVLLGEKVSHEIVGGLQDFSIIQELFGSEEIMKLDHAELVVWKSDQAFSEMDAMDKTFLKTMSKRYDLFVDFPFDKSNIQNVLNVVKPSGIVLRGGAEEKVGFKSFDDLDEIFEAIEDFD